MGNDEEFLYPDITYRIRAAIFKVRNELGSAFKESVYQKALEKELSKQKLKFKSQPTVNIIYDDEASIGIYRPDFVVEERVLVEIKVKPFLTKHDEKQLWYYLKATDYKVAILVNFGGKRLEIKRWVYDKAREKKSA